MAHTKGEWKKETKPTDVVITSNGVAICAMNWNLEEYEANAKLIAAAPDMLINLIRLVDRLEENELGDLNAVKRAKEVIKKATE